MRRPAGRPHAESHAPAVDVRPARQLDAPLLGVYGNNAQGERAALAAAATELHVTLPTPPLALSLAGRRVVVAYDPRQLKGLHEAADVPLHGPRTGIAQSAMAG